MSNFVEDGAFVNSIVGEGTKLNGELDLNGLLRIDGDFTGKIKTNGKVLIGKNGRAKCTITASTVVVGGAIKGDIYSSEKVVILSSGIMIGNVFSPRLIIEEGVIFDGNCIISNSAGEKQEEKFVKDKDLMEKKPVIYNSNYNLEKQEEKNYKEIVDKYSETEKQETTNVKNNL
ncbi:MAG: polymer-forming cytoskeletal protein [Endomicrobium sp.]|nr:polymer-forming cytoskeletal protein [Endomicrobium sp.]